MVAVGGGCSHVPSQAVEVPPWLLGHGVVSRVNIEKEEWAAQRPRCRRTAWFFLCQWVPLALHGDLCPPGEECRLASLMLPK